MNASTGGPAAVLGIDAGGTHTDAALCGPEGVIASAKVPTCHDDLPSSLRAVLAALRAMPGVADRLASVGRVTLGTTLALNAMVQGRTDPVGLILTAGPGLDPRRAAVGDRVFVAPGGLDHRGVEVSPLKTEGAAEAAARWRREGVTALACVGRFSPRNPAHENALRDAILAAVPDADITLGHALSGRLGFPRRVASAHCNAAVRRVLSGFLDAAEKALAECGIDAPVRLLKADGGALPAAASRREPVQSILSGPAAGVMGVLALCPSLADDDAALLMDVGGTTTDLAVFAHGSPVLDRGGMRVNGRRTLVRALATLSIGVGGDSRISVRSGAVAVGPMRDGPAMAFGGSAPTLLDALNVRARIRGGGSAGDTAASASGIAALAAEAGMTPDNLALRAVDDALARIAAAVRSLLEDVNARPAHTLAALREIRGVVPRRAWLLGGPADILRPLLEDALNLPVSCAPHADVANAAGAALALPTASLDVYADSATRILRAPALDVREELPRSATPETVRVRALELLRESMERDSPGSAPALEVLEEDVFAVLDDAGRGSRDMRVTCQAVPGVARLA